MMFAPDRRLPLGASSSAAATAERLQFTVVGGLCLEAHDSGEPVIADEAELAARWPAMFDELVQRTVYRAVIAVPLPQDLRGIGALDLFLTSNDRLAALPFAATVAVARAVTDLLGRGPAGLAGPAWLDSPAATTRSRLWQAVGLVNPGAELDSVDALALLRGYAYGHDLLIDELADQLLGRRLSPADPTADQGAHS